MERQPARVLEPGDVCRLLTHVEGQRHPLRNRVIVMLSFKAGLRACEIAGLRWPMVLKSNGTIADGIIIASMIAKYRSSRTIPMHVDLKRALARYHRSMGHPTKGPVILSERGSAMTARSIVNWFANCYEALELGCLGSGLI